MKKRVLMFLWLIGALVFSSSIVYANDAKDLGEASEKALSEDGEYSMLLDKVEGDNIETFYIKRPNPEALKNNIVNASRFGLSVNNEDNYKAFSAALAYCRSNPNTYLVIDKGVYYFKTDANLQLSGLKNVLIEGNGAEFIFQTQKQFSINACDGVEIRNLIVDWNWAVDRVGSLVKVQNKTPNSFEIVFLELDEVDENIPLASFQQYDSKELIAGSYGAYKTFSPVEVPDSIVNVEKLEPNVLKVEISEQFTTSFHNEEVYLLRHYTYGGEAFAVGDGSSNITFDNVSIYGFAGMGYVIGDKANHFQIINSYIGLRPGNENNQRLATSADGMHILNTGGYFRVDNCDFSFTGDDIFNIHDDMLKITEFISDNQLIGDVTSGFVNKGDKIRIYNSNIEDIGFETEVVANVRKGLTSTLTLKDPIPSDVEEGYFIYRSSCRTHNYVISNNYIHETKGRVALLNASDGLFENNRLYRTKSECLQVRVDLSDKKDKIWYEGSGASNVVIKNNIFEECAFGGEGPIVKIDCNIGNKIDVLSDVHVLDNEFFYCYGELVGADNVTDLYVKNNKIVDCGKIIISQYCGAVYIEDNDISFPSQTCPHTDTMKVHDRQPGCFEYGSTGQTYCNQCHTIIDSSYRGIPPLNHKNLLEKRIDVEQTCGKAGSASMVCSLCRTVVETGIEVPATGEHEYSKYVSIGNGKHKLVCKNCDEVLAGHEADKCEGCAPTSFDNGYATYTCALCSGTYRDKYISPVKLSVSLSMQHCDMPINSNAALVAAVLPENQPQLITWTSSDSRIAAVSGSGIVTAHDYGKVTITATAVDGSFATCTIQTRFCDVNGTNDKNDKENYQYYYDPVYWAADNGITKGYEDGSFGPQLDCERRALTTFLWRMNGCPEPMKNATAYFADMGSYSANSAANKSVAWAYEIGITKGYTENGKRYFKPKASITRKDTLIMLYRMAGKPATSGKLDFVDTTSYKKGTDTYNAILWARSNKITGGYKEDGKLLFKPDEPCLREHIVTFLYRYDRLS